MAKPKVRTGTPSVQLSKDQFSKRARERFYDPSFTAVSAEIDRAIEVAWKNYREYHKSPRTKRAGAGFSDIEFQLPVEWLQAREKIKQAEAGQKNARAKSRILLINGSSRSDQTCPGEMSKTYRLAKMARKSHRQGAGLRGRFSRPQQARIGIRQNHLSLQSLRLDRHAVMPLALLLLPKPRARTGQRLDGGNLPALGSGAWRDASLSGQLVPST